MPVALAAGADAWEPAQDLRGVPEVRLVASPRHAVVLLVAGTIADDDREALHRVHDQLPRPRGVVAWRPGGAAADVPATVVDDDLDAVVRAVQRVAADAVADPATGSADLLPDTEPNAWRGVGPFGQGGEGMMGGTPYGRPMTMTGDDRDGLALDRLELTLGPFLDPLPAGCSLTVTLQGEVLQQVDLTVRGVGDARIAPTAPRRRLLRRTAHGLHVAGLDAMAARAAALSRRIGDDADPNWAAGALRGLVRRIRCSGLLWTLRGVAVLDGADAADRWQARLAALADGATDAPGRPGIRELEEALVGATLTDAMAALASVDVPAPQPVTAGGS